MLKCWLPWFYFFSYFIFVQKVCFIHLFFKMDWNSSEIFTIGSLRSFSCFNHFFSSFFILSQDTRVKGKIVYCYLLGERIRNWVQNIENKRQKESTKHSQNVFIITQTRNLTLQSLLSSTFRRYFIYIDYFRLYCYSMFGTKGSF